MVILNPYRILYQEKKRERERDLVTFAVMKYAITSWSRFLNWSILDLQCCVNSGKQQSNSVIYSSMLWFITGYWLYFPVLYSRTLLFIHSMYNSLCLLTPNSHSIPPPPPTPPPAVGNHKSVLFVCLFHR